MRFALPAAVLLLFGSGAAFAFTLKPVKQDFTPSGPGTIQSFQLENDGNENVALRIKIFVREMDEHGKEELLPAEGLFLIYPPQIVLKPKSSQTLKIQWRGQSRVDTELAYRLLVEQLPVNFQEDTTPGGKIRILVRYMGALYVVPSRLKHDVVLESSAPAVNDKGEKGVEVVFHNRGNAHTLLGELEIKASLPDAMSGEPLTLKSDELRGISGENVLPGKKRRFFLPLPEKYVRDDVRIDFDFKPLR